MVISMVLGYNITKDIYWNKNQGGLDYEKKTGVTYYNFNSIEGMNIENGKEINIKDEQKYENEHEDDLEI